MELGLPQYWSFTLSIHLLLISAILANINTLCKIPKTYCGFFSWSVGSGIMLLETLGAIICVIQTQENIWLSTTTVTAGTAPRSPPTEHFTRLRSQLGLEDTARALHWNSRPLCPGRPINFHHYIWPFSFLSTWVTFHKVVNSYIIATGEIWVQWQLPSARHSYNTERGESGSLPAKFVLYLCNEGTKILHSVVKCWEIDPEKSFHKCGGLNPWLHNVKCTRPLIKP